MRESCSRFRRAGRCALALALGVSVLALSACADTLQDRPIAHGTLESLLVAPYPVYWLGGTFRRLAITEATADPSGAFSLQYGDCVRGGEGTCVPPVRVVSSPDNSFVPGGSYPRRSTELRGVRAFLAQDGRTIEIPTGGVVVDVFAASAALASAAAQTMVPINGAGAPASPLPARLPDTGFAETPLPAQVPPPVHPLP